MFFELLVKVITDFDKQPGQLVVLFGGKESVQAAGPVLQLHQHLRKGSDDPALAIHCRSPGLAEHGFACLVRVLFGHTAQRVQAVCNRNNATQPAQLLHHERLFFEQTIKHFLYGETGRGRFIPQLFLRGQKFLNCLDHIPVNAAGIFQLANF